MRDETVRRATQATIRVLPRWAWIDDVFEVADRLVITLDGGKWRRRLSGKDGQQQVAERAMLAIGQGEPGVKAEVWWR